MTPSSGQGLDSGSWDEYRLMVLHRLKQIEDAFSDLRQAHEDQLRTASLEYLRISTEVAEIKTKIVMWGALGGIIGGAIVTVITAILVKVVAKAIP